MLIPISAIKIPENRFRRDFDEGKMAELLSSISRLGLLQPIVVEKSNDDSYTLRAGERRLRCITKINEAGSDVPDSKGYVPPGHIACVLLETLDPLTRIEIEVEENTIRTDFTWQERTKAIAALHSLRQAKNPDQTLTDTASEISGKAARGTQISVVSDALLLDRHLNDKDVAGAKTPADALKIVKRKAEAAHRERLSKNFDITKTPHVMYKEEALHALERLAATQQYFDVIITDPPYGIAADNFGEQSSAGHDYEDSKTNLKEIMSWLPDSLTAVAKPQSHLYLFCDWRFFDDWSAHFVLANWRVWPLPLIWNKNGGMLPMPSHGPRRTYECILYAYRGERETLLVKPDVISIPGIKKPLHGAQKPVALYVDLLSRSARPGDRILDPFGGTGPVLVAANKMRLRATYIERDEVPYNIAVARLNKSEIDDGAYDDAGLGNIEFDSAPLPAIGAL